MHEEPVPPAVASEVERRVEQRRKEDRDRERALAAVVTVAVALGVAWGTATAVLAGKVDRVEQLRVDAAQDARIQANTARIDGIGEALQAIKGGVDSANIRLHQMACDGKPASCR